MFLPFLPSHGYAGFIEFTIETLLYFQRELCTQAVSHILDTAVKRIFPSRLTVRVCTHLSVCGNRTVGNILPFALEEGVMIERNREAVAFGDRGGLYKLLFNALTNFFTRLLLQDNQVAAHIRARILGEHTRRQADGGDKPAILHEVTTDGFILGAVQYALRGNKCKKSALFDSVQPFHKKIIVNGSGGFPFKYVLSLAITTVIDHKVAKGDVAGYKVVFILFLQFSNGFKGFSPNKDIILAVRMKGLCDACRQYVFFHSIDYTGTFGKGFGKGSHTCGRVQASSYLHVGGT